MVIAPNTIIINVLASDDNGYIKLIINITNNGVVKEYNDILNNSLKDKFTFNIDLAIFPTNAIINDS